MIDLGISLTSLCILNQGGGGITPLFTIDRENGRYMIGATSYATEADLKTALGGTATALALNAFSGDYDPGFSALYQSDFSSGVDGWATLSGPGSLSSVSGAMRIAVTGTYRASRAVPITGKRKGVRLTANETANAGANSKIILGGSSTSLNTAGTVTSATFGAAPDAKTIIVSSNDTDVILGVGTGSATGSWDIGSYSAKEVYPYNGYIPGEVGMTCEITVPATMATAKVVAEWACGDEDHRLRLETDASGHLVARASITASDVAVLDMGSVVAGSRHSVKLAAITDGFYASMDGGVPVQDNAGTFPGVGLFFLGRSTTGEAWDGTTHNVKVYARAKDGGAVDPVKAFNIYGDSTAAETGSTGGAWSEVLCNSYSPPRIRRKNATGGLGSSAILANVAADNEFYREWTTIFMDRPNTGEDPAQWIANYKAAVAYLLTARWFIMPPAQDSPSGTSAINIATVQASLLSDPFFAGHTFDSATQAAYLAEANDDATRSGTGDWTHFNDTGQGIQATYIKAFFDGAGW